MEAPSAGAPEGRVRRADDVLELQRVARKGGSGRILQWLATRTGAQILLREPGAGTQHPSEPTGPEGRLVKRACETLASRRLDSVVIEDDGLTCLALPLDGQPDCPGPVLIALYRGPAPAGLPLLLADAASTLGLYWQAERLEERRRLWQRADAHAREAVLHLLMNGHVTAARQVAGALSPALPDVVRVGVIEGPYTERGALADQMTARMDTDGWIVRCPVYANHHIVIAPADLDEPMHLPSWAFAASGSQNLRVGLSDPFALADTATAYAQAFHALAVARHSPDRAATFSSRPDLTLALDFEGASAWAQDFLAPLFTHSRRRLQDPTSEELLSTAASWLAFSGKAAAHLKIHRNTLAGRLRLISELLRLELDLLAHQAQLSVALRIAGNPVRPAAPHTPVPAWEELLLSQRVAVWAEAQLRPLREAAVPSYLEKTLRTWLQHDARTECTARALNISASAVRKRLTRCETLLGRSLLQTPSSVQDQWIAQHVLPLGGARHISP